MFLQQRIVNSLRVFASISFHVDRMASIITAGGDFESKAGQQPGDSTAGPDRAFSAFALRITEGWPSRASCAIGAGRISFRR
jgi:hypothetical protein